MIEFPTDTKAAIGETVHFLVHVEGYPQPSLSWEYQGEPVTSLGPIQIFTDGSLILNDVKTQYSGRYTFVAGNPAGKINRVVNLQVVSEEESCEDDEENEKSKSCRSVLIEHKPIPIELLEKYVETHHEYDNDPFQFLFSVSIKPICTSCITSVYIPLYALVACVFVFVFDKQSSLHCTIVIQLFICVYKASHFRIPVYYKQHIVLS